jgi:inosine/xanthosine triphosphatase
MIIRVGTKNPAKVAAFRELMAEYAFLTDAALEPVDVHSGVSDQPKTLEETILGARNRAHRAYVAGRSADLGVGIESGLFPVPYSQTGHMDLCACAIFDGVRYHLGLSSAFECPPEVTRLMLEEGLDMNQAFGRCGLTDKPKLGNEEGAVGILTKGRVDRKAYTKQAIVMALIHLEKP